MPPASACPSASAAARTRVGRRRIRYDAADFRSRRGRVPFRIPETFRLVTSSLYVLYNPSMELAERLHRLGTETAFSVSLAAADWAGRGNRVFPFHLGDLVGLFIAFAGVLL